MSTGTGVAAVVAAVILWGVQLPVATLAFAHVDPYHLTAIRYSVALLVLVPLLVYREGLETLGFRGRFIGASAVGISGTCISPLLTFVGLSYSQPEHAVIISALQPLMVAIGDRLFRHRSLSRFTLGCVFLALFGVLMVVTEGRALHELGVRQLLGDVLIFGGAVAWVTFAMARENFREWTSLSFTTLTIVPGTIATVAIVVAGVAAGAVPHLSPADVSAAWPQLFYLSFGSALLAMLCWNAGNRRIGALDAMLLINLQPVVTFTVRFLQGYRFTVLELLGAVIVVGVLVANTLYLRTRDTDIARSSLALARSNGRAAIDRFPRR